MHTFRLVCHRHTNPTIIKLPAHDSSLQQQQILVNHSARVCVYKNVCKSVQVYSHYKNVLLFDNTGDAGITGGGGVQMNIRMTDVCRNTWCARNNTVLYLNAIYVCWCLCWEVWEMCVCVCVSRCTDSMRDTVVYYILYIGANENSMLRYKVLETTARSVSVKGTFLCCMRTWPLARSALLLKTHTRQHNNLQSTGTCWPESKEKGAP